MPTIKELAEKSPKKCWSKVDATWHYLALYVTRPLLKTNITPNQITITWIILEFIAAALMLGSYPFRIASILIFNFLVNILDFTDGNIARIKNIKTFSGIYWEYVGIFVGMPLLLLFIGIGGYIRDQNIELLYLGAACCIFMLYEKLLSINACWYDSQKWPQLKEAYLESSLSKKNIFSYISELFRKAQPFNLLFFGVILDYLYYTLVIYTVISFLGMIRRIINQARAIKKLDKTIAPAKDL